MPRGRTKEILHTARIDNSPGKRMCRGDRKNHTIQRGSAFLAIKDGLGEKSYCLKCARAIIDQGRKRLDTLVCKLEEAERCD